VVSLIHWQIASLSSIKQLFRITVKSIQFYSEASICRLKFKDVFYISVDRVNLLCFHFHSKESDTMMFKEHASPE